MMSKLKRYYIEKTVFEILDKHFIPLEIQYKLHQTDFLCIFLIKMKYIFVGAEKNEKY